MIHLTTVNQGFFFKKIRWHDALPVEAMTYNNKNVPSFLGLLGWLVKKSLFRFNMIDCIKKYVFRTP